MKKTGKAIGFKKEFRLKKKSEIEKVIFTGKRFISGDLKAFIIYDGFEKSRFTVIVKKSAGIAAKRNRCRRVIRETILKEAASFKSDFELVIIYTGKIQYKNEEKGDFFGNIRNRLAALIERLSLY